MFLYVRRYRRSIRLPPCAPLRSAVGVMGQAQGRALRYYWVGVFVVRHSEPYSDTDPRAMAVWVSLLRNQSAADKIAAVFELTALAWDMAERGVRSHYPNASEREVFLRTAALHLSRDEMIRAYQWDPQEHEQPGQRV